MNFKNILPILLVLFYINGYSQEDSLIIELKKLEVKAINPQKTIYQSVKVDELIQQSNVGKDLAHQLESLPGVQVRKSGSNISKPLIDGLSSSRLVYMLNGVKLENQDWADAHSPEIDADLADDLSVVRGAETVKYGSNALGGTVNVNASNIPFNKKINGSAKVHYISNTGGWGGSMKIQQNLDLIKGLRWRLSANNTQNGDYSTAEYNVTNSGTRLESYSAELDYKFKNLELKTFYSIYNSKQGNYFGALTGNIEEFEERIAAGRPLVVLPYSFNVNAPHQQSKHNIANVEGKWKFKNDWYVKAQYTHQKNNREEFDVRRSLSNAVPVQDMILTSTHINTDLGFQNHSLHAVIGFQLRDKENVNQPGTAVTAALPNYIYKEKSIYTYHTLELKNWALNAGLRYDWAKSTARGINFLGKEYGTKKDFSSFSAQLAAEYANKKWDINSSLSYGWRVPESHELYANGKQHGLPIYFVGDSDLEEEKGLKWLNTINFKTAKTETEVQGFVNYLENYIYAIPSHQYKQLFSGPAAIFQFKQQDAIIYGVDLIQHTQISPKLELTNKISWIKGEEIDTKNALPTISPLRIHNHFRYHFPSWGKFSENTMQFSHDWVGKKKDFNPAYELSNNVPEAYNLFHLTLSSAYQMKDSKGFKFTFSVDNLFNQLYKDYLNLHRYFVHDRGRSININIQFNF